MIEYIYIVDQVYISKTNGIGTYLDELIDCVNKLGINPCIISCDPSVKKFTLLKEEKIQKILFPTLNITSEQYYEIFIYFLRFHIKDDEKNIFIFNYNNTCNLIRDIKKYFPKSKTSFTIHDMNWTVHLLGDTSKLIQTLKSENAKYHNIIEKYFEEEELMYNLVDRLVVLSEETLNILIQIYNIPKEKIWLIKNGKKDEYIKLSFDEKRNLKKSLYIDPKIKIIIFAGRINIIKGVFHLIRAYKEVLKEYPDCLLVFAGEIYSKEIYSHISGVESKVIFTGHLQKNEVYSWYRIADIGVLPSYFEQCSYSGIEMMMHSLPVVASDGFCVKDMFINNHNALVAKIIDRDDLSIFEKNLSNAILELLVSSDICERLKINSRLTYEELYNIDKMEQRYHEFFSIL